MFKKIIQKDGFSLVELLIYIAILGAVSGIAVSILTTVTKTQIRESALINVSGQIEFITQTIQRLVTDSSLINIDAGIASSTLTLRMPELVNDPTLIYLSNGKIYVQQETNPAQSITSADVNVDSLQFKKISQAPGKDTVQIDIAISAVQQAAGRTITRALRTAVARVNAAEFDSNLLPNADNLLDIGATTPRWKSGYFSQGVTIATVSGNVGIGTASPSYKLDVSGTFRVTATSTFATSTFSGNVGIGTTDPTYQLKIVSTNTGNIGDVLLSTESSAVGNNSIRIKNNSTGGKEYLLSTTGNNHVYGSGAFMIFDNSSSSARLFISSAGNVGIGSVAPLSALSINGGLHVGGDSAAGDNNLLVDGKITGRIAPRIYTIASTASLTPEIDTYDYFEITVLAAALTINNPSTSVPTGGEKMIIAITSDSSARALTYGTVYVAKGGVALPTTTVASKTTTLGFIYNAGLAKWNLVAVAQES
jgi:type II secretory pathway pseudopilin PulG